MATENDTTPSGWTLEPLKQMLTSMLHDYKLENDRRFDEVHREMELRAKAIEDAVAERKVALRDLMQQAEVRHQQQFTSMFNHTDAALLSAKEAVVKAETANEKRFDSVNEFRATLSDQATKLMPRAEAEARFAAFAEKIEDAVRRLDRGDGKTTGFSQSGAVIMAIIIGATALIGVGINAISSVFHPASTTVITPK